MVSGGVGALLLFIWLMIRYFTRMKDAPPIIIIMFLPTAVAILIHNVFESGLLTGRGIIWIMMLVIVLLQTTVKDATLAPRRKTSPRDPLRSSGLR